MRRRWWYLGSVTLLCAAVLASGLWLMQSNELLRGGTAQDASLAEWLSYRARFDDEDLHRMLVLCRELGSLCPRAEIGNQLHNLIDALESLGAADLVARSHPVADTADAEGLGALGPPRSGAQSRLAPAAQRATVVLGTDSAGDVTASIAAGEATPPARLPASGNQPAPALLLLVTCCLGVAIVVSIEMLQRRRTLSKIRKLRLSASSLRGETMRLLEGLPLAVVVVSADGRLVFINGAASEMLDENRQANRISTAPLVRALRAPVEETAVADAGHLRDVVLEGSDGSVRRLLVATRPIRYAGAPARLCVAFDNTLLRDEEHTTTVGRLAMLGELNAAIAHELSRPLAVIRAAATNGRNQARIRLDPDRIVHRFDRIDKQVGRAQRIIESIRRLGRPSDATGTQFGITQSLHTVLELIQEHYRRAGVDLQADINLEEHLTGSGDPTLFEIAVLNILANAADAFDDQDRVVPAQVRLSANLEGSTVEVSVADTAGGIPNEVLPQVFEPFVTTKPSSRGTGLGLAIASRAIGTMHGTITAHNNSRGAVITVRFPTSGGMAA